MSFMHKILLFSLLGAAVLPACKQAPDQLLLSQKGEWDYAYKRTELASGTVTYTEAGTLTFFDNDSVEVREFGYTPYMEDWHYHKDQKLLYFGGDEFEVTKATRKEQVWTRTCSSCSDPYTQEYKLTR